MTILIVIIDLAKINAWLDERVSSAERALCQSKVYKRHFILESIQCGV